MSGFAASIYKRGLKFINVPSTLLSQVDSSIGGKTGINNKFGKNLIGSFYQPDLVISDTNLLASLPKREIVCGYAEILKHSLIKNKKLFLFLDKNLRNILNLKKNFIEKAILESCKIKKKVVEQDEKEINLRKSLNFGHTFGHSYEATLEYSKKLNHGEAVLYGILSATKLSKKLKSIKKNEYNLILSHLSKLGFSNLRKFFKSSDLNKIIMFMPGLYKSLPSQLGINSKMSWKLLCDEFLELVRLLSNELKDYNFILKSKKRDFDLMKNQLLEIEKMNIRIDTKSLALDLLKDSKFSVGFNSMALIESACYKVPTINCMFGEAKKIRYKKYIHDYGSLIKNVYSISAAIEYVKKNLNIQTNNVIDGKNKKILYKLIGNSQGNSIIRIRKEIDKII